MITHDKRKRIRSFTVVNDASAAVTVDVDCGWSIVVSDELSDDHVVLVADLQLSNDLIDVTSSLTEPFTTMPVDISAACLHVDQHLNLRLTRVAVDLHRSTMINDRGL